MARTRRAFASSSTPVTATPSGNFTQDTPAPTEERQLCVATSTHAHPTWVPPMRFLALQPILLSLWRPACRNYCTWPRRRQQPVINFTGTRGCPFRSVFFVVADKRRQEAGASARGQGRRKGVHRLEACAARLGDRRRKRVAAANRPQTRRNAWEGDQRQGSLTGMTSDIGQALNNSDQVMARNNAEVRYNLPRQPACGARSGGKPIRRIMAGKKVRV